MAQYNSKNQSSRVSRRWFSDIDINMTLHPVSKDLTLKFDINAIKRSIKNLLSTNTFERPFRPGLGIDLTSMLFELDSDITNRVVLESDIRSLINNFEPRANVTHVFTSLIGTSLDVTIQLTISNDPRPQEITIILQRVR